MASAEELKTARLRRVIGLGVTLAALAFIAYVIVEQRVWTANIPWGRLAGTMVLAVVIYAASCQILAWGWMHLLHLFGGKALPMWPGCRIFSLTNIAKYLPGKMFPFASRHASARKAGAPDASLIYALLAEALFLLLAAFTWVLPFAAFLVWAVATHRSFYAIAALSLFVGIVGFAGWFLKRSDLLEGIRAANPGGLWIVRPLFAILAAYLAFFGISGSLTWLIAAALTGGDAGASVTTFISIAALCWAVGYVVPGASAGIGLREAAMIAVLSQYLTPEHAVIAALAYRLVTVLGDALFFAGYWLAGRRFPALLQSPQ